MILGYDSNLGATVLLDTVDYTPPLVGFTSVTFGGGGGSGTNGMIISTVWGQEQPLTQEYLDNYNVTMAQWTADTYLLALYSDSFEGGILMGLGDIEGWSLYRLDSETNQAVLLGNFDADTKKYIDYTTLLNTNYQYILYAYGTNDVSSALTSSLASPAYYGYYLIDVTNDVVYKFDTNFSGGELQQNTDYASFMTNNKYKTYHAGELQYLSGNIAALVRYAESDNFVNNTVELLRNLRDCIKDDSRIKILKTRKGEGWYVFTYDYKDNVVNQAIGEQPVNASFSFDEIGNLRDGINNSALKTVQ